MVPQLLEMTVRFFTPRRASSRMQFSGLPDRPKPPDMITAPSCMSCRAFSAFSKTLFIAPGSLDPGAIRVKPRVGAAWSTIQECESSR